MTTAAPPGFFLGGGHGGGLRVAPAPPSCGDPQLVARPLIDVQAWLMAVRALSWLGFGLWHCCWYRTSQSALRHSLCRVFSLI
jgi:hypothetical protein